MDFIKRYPLFTIMTSLLIIAGLAQFVMAFVFMAGVGDAKQKFDSAMSSRQSAIQLTPRPSVENLEIAKDNLETLERDYADKRETIAGQGVEQLRQGMPDKPSDLFFNLRKLITDYRAEAQKLKTINTKASDGSIVEVEVDSIAIEEGFTFGFGEYIEASKGPDEEYIEEVWIQRQVINYLLRELYDAQPVGIIGVEREPVPQIKREKNNSRGELPRDTFLIRESISARVPGIIETKAFRITFTGYSDALRNFLNSLATNKYSLVVSSVEVKTAQDQEESSTNQGQQNNSPDAFSQLFGGDTSAPADLDITVEEPVVVDNISEFTVIVELIEVKQLDEASTEEEEGDPEQI